MKEKLAEYIANGAQLGVLIDRKNRTVHIYRPNAAPEILDNPTQVSCEPQLPGFVLKMTRIW